MVTEILRDGRTGRRTDIKLYYRLRILHFENCLIENFVRGLYYMVFCCLIELLVDVTLALKGDHENSLKPPKDIDKASQKVHPIQTSIFREKTLLLYSKG